MIDLLQYLSQADSSMNTSMRSSIQSKAIKSIQHDHSQSPDGLICRLVEVATKTVSCDLP
jgi:hypothetical protein